MAGSRACGWNAHFSAGTSSTISAFGIATRSPGTCATCFSIRARFRGRTSNRSVSARWSRVTSAEPETTRRKSTKCCRSSSCTACLSIRSSVCLQADLNESMPASLATLVFVLFIAGLFWLDRDRDGEARTSPALWLPIAWMFIGSSRMVSQWLGIEPVGIMDQTVEGSPFDRLLLTVMLAGGWMIPASRAERVGALLRNNTVLVVFFLYCIVSVLWSDFPFVALKRLTKGVGNLTMVLIILSEPDPLAAMKRFLTWSGFLLVPISVLLIKYYPALGRMYNRWTWENVFTGVSTDKNGLGGICLLIGLTSLWNIIEARRQARGDSLWRRPLIAHVVVLAMVLWLFGKADSSTR